MNANNKKMWDVIVIGGGVIGCAVTRKFTLMGAKTLLLERGGDILSGQVKQIARCYILVLMPHQGH